MNHSKENAYDGKGTMAGNPHQDSEQITVDELSAQAGLNLPTGETVATQSRLHKRDEDRWELNPESAETELQHFLSR
ncbi:MAG: hypothetical protein F6J95_021380 [Leptolyngbya sp. SIO1E4]|nr:hypothetical protein [Leptolyngbya sp. SIO1E4]